MKPLPSSVIPKLGREKRLEFLELKCDNFKRGKVVKVFEGAFKKIRTCSPL